MYSVYFLKSLRNRKVYVGSTNKTPITRLEEHNNGSNAWSKHNGPFELTYYETYNCEKDAQQRESFYKSGFGKQIKSLIVELLEQKNIKPKIGM